MDEKIEVWHNNLASGILRKEQTERNMDNS